MMGEALRGLELYDPDFPLKSFPHQWDILGIDGFDRAVELAASGFLTVSAEALEAPWAGLLDCRTGPWQSESAV